MTPDQPQRAPMRIAIIDDDSGFIQVLGKRLERLGRSHRVVAGPVPVTELAAMRLSALVVDPRLLGAQAEEYLIRVCSEIPELAVIVCAGPSTVAQRVRALRLGVDDWLTKPCHPEELIARIEVVTRRGRRGRRGVAVAGEEQVVAGELAIRADRFEAFVGGRPAELTRREYELLALLVASGGRVLEREEVYRQVWGYTMAHGDRSVDVFVRRLRKKLARISPAWRYIHTHFGVGYRFAPEPAAGIEPVATHAADAPAVLVAADAEPVLTGIV